MPLDGGCSPRPDPSLALGSLKSHLLADLTVRQRLRPQPAHPLGLRLRHRPGPRRNGRQKLLRGPQDARDDLVRVDRPIVLDQPPGGLGADEQGAVAGRPAPERSAEGRRSTPEPPAPGRPSTDATGAHRAWTPSRGGVALELRRKKLVQPAPDLTLLRLPPGRPGVALAPCERRGFPARRPRAAGLRPRPQAVRPRSGVGLARPPARRWAGNRPCGR
jgi:hypothetical protein